MDSLSAYQRPDGLVDASSADFTLGRQLGMVGKPLRMASSRGAVSGRNVHLQLLQARLRIITKYQAQGRIDSRWTEATHMVKAFWAAHAVQPLEQAWERLKVFLNNDPSA